MSKQININDTLTFIPSGNTGTTNLSTSSSSYPVSNGYADHTSTTYARFTTQTTAGYTYYTFSVSGIPENATIDSVSCTARIYVNSTNRVTNTNIQLYSGTTAKGSSSTFASTTSSNTVTISGGTWTLSELSSARLRFGGTKSGSNQSGYINFCGATLSVTYSISGTAYTITSTSSVTGVTVSPATQDIMSGESGVVTIEGISDINDITVTDNDTDITSQLVQQQYSSGGTVSTDLGTYTLVSGGFNGQGATYFSGIVGNGVNASTTSNNYYSSGSGTIAVFTYDMAFTNIPSNATITRVYCEVNGHAESTSNSSEYMCAQLISGNTELSEELNFKSIGTSNSTQTLEATTLPTIAQLAEMKLQCRLGYYGGAINGATCYVVYTTPSSGYYYTYTISNIADDHVILIEEAGAFIPPEEDPTYNYYPVTISSINATTNPGTGTTRVVEGTNQTITITPTESQVTLILDNGTDVSSQLVSHSNGTPSYTVNSVSGASYGFTLNSSTGYYTSTNAGHANSAALARVSFSLPVRCLVTFSYINYAEATYDYGIFGNIDTALETTYTVDSNAKLICDTSTYNTSEVQTLTYEIESGEHFIDIKYRKDTYTDNNNDNLQFKIDSITELETNNYYTYTLSNISARHNLIFVFGNVSYYYVTSSGSGCKLYPDGQFVELAGDSYKLTIVPDDPNASVSITDNNTNVTSSLELKTTQIEKDGVTTTYKSYNYTISNIAAAHTLFVTCSTNGTVYLKVNGSWVAFSKVYKKIDNRWQEQTDFSNLFDSTKIYIKV